MGDDESIFCCQVKFSIPKITLLLNLATVKPTFTKIFYLICIVTFLGSCDQREVPVPAEQEILFEVYYINHAWGKQHSGFLIDKDGNIKTYKDPADWNFASADKEISVDQIAKNLSKTVLASTKISQEELNEYASRIYTIDQKKLSKPVSVGADMGERVFVTYNYNSVKQTYKQVLISKSGDWESENKDKSAQEIKNWLIEIGKKIKQ